MNDMSTDILHIEHIINLANMQREIGSKLLFEKETDDSDSGSEHQ